MWKQEIEKIQGPLTNEEFEKLTTKYSGRAKGILNHYIDHDRNYIYKQGNDDELFITHKCYSLINSHFIKPFYIESDDGEQSIYDMYKLYRTISLIDLNKSDIRLCYLQYILILKYTNNELGFIPGDSHRGNIIMISEKHNISLCDYEFPVNYLVKIVDLEFSSLKNMKTYSSMYVDIISMLHSLKGEDEVLCKIYEEIKSETGYNEYSDNDTLSKYIIFNIDDFIQKVYEMIFLF